MKIILFYDITDNSRLNKIRKVCTKYLLHIQYSTFEGELEKYELIALKKELKEIIDKKNDSIIIFNFAYVKDSNKEILGISKNEFDGYNI